MIRLKETLTNWQLQNLSKNNLEKISDVCTVPNRGDKKMKVPVFPGENHE
jgi:hypothetical protein